MNILDFRFSICDLKSKIKSQKSKIACVFLVSCILFLGCGADPEEEEVSTPEEDIRSGWDKYEAGNYGAAILAFETVLARGADVSPAIMADAYNGLGWSYLGFSRSAGVNQKNIEISLSKFQEAITLDSTNADAWVGQAGLLLIRRSSQDDYLRALKAIDSALQGSAAYSYRHDYDSEADLYALKAQCYFYLGELDKAQDEIKRALAIEEGNSATLAMKKLLY